MYGFTSGVNVNTDWRMSNTGERVIFWRVGIFSMLVKPIYIGVVRKKAFVALKRPFRMLTVNLYVYDQSNNALLTNASVDVIRSSGIERYNTGETGKITFKVREEELVEIKVYKYRYLTDRLFLFVGRDINALYKFNLYVYDYHAETPIANATVEISGGTEYYSGSTDANGLFSVTLNRGVEYDINVTAAGYDYGEKLKFIIL